jgi:hypothetical protein
MNTTESLTNRGLGNTVTSSFLEECFLPLQLSSDETSVIRSDSSFSFDSSDFGPIGVLFCGIILATFTP